MPLIFDGMLETRFILWLENRISPDMIDTLVCTEIPNTEVDIVKTNMMHVLCSLLNNNSPC